MLVEAMEERRLMSADLDAVTLAEAFGGDADRISSNLLSAYFLGQSSAINAAASQVSVDAFAEPATVSLQSRAMNLAQQDVANGELMPTLLTDSAGRIGVVFTATDPVALVPYLQNLGVAVVATDPTYHRVEGYAPLAALPAISELGPNGLLGISEVAVPKTNSGTVNSQADNILEADRVRTSIPGYTGAGVKIGVLSDSYDKGSGVTRAALSISSGNLPANVQVLQDYNSTGLSTSVEDEGRAMLELIYDLAPGAGLGFATADISESQFAANIQNLANAGYTVIVDDVAYFDEPFFQDGIVAQAVNNVVANNNVTYFSSAGNEGNLSYDSAATTAYGPSPLNFATQTISAISTTASSYYDWNPGSTVDTMMSITIPYGRLVEPNFEWDQPFYTTSGVTTNLDFYLLSYNASTGVYTTRARSTTNNVANQTPESLFGYQNTLTGTNATTQFYLVVRNTNGGPTVGRIKFIDEYGDSGVTYNNYFTYSSTIVGHAAAASAMGVGASPFFDQTNPEDFSSTGPSTILFNADGTRKSTPEVRAKPDILSIDGADTSFFIPNDDYDGNGYNNFFGTSAAAPHAAAVAALIRQAFPGYTPAQVYSLMKATADPTVGNGDSNVIGAGLIDAYRAIYGGSVPATTPLSDGFESSTLGTDWQIYKQGSGLTQVVATNSPATGLYQLVLGQNFGYGTTGFYQSGLNEAIVHINAAGKTGVLFSFNEKEFSNETDDAMPASFSGHGNYDGVALSVDGTTWYRIVSLTGAASLTSFQNESFNLSTIAAGLGLTLTADTRIKFQQYDALSYAVGVHGIAIDDVKVTTQSLVTAPTIDNGGVQRSAIRSLTVNFAGNVTTVPASAFALIRTGDGMSFPVNISSITHPTSSTTTVILTFGGSLLEGSSLPDGRYVLSIIGSQLLDDSGRMVDADGDGIDGGTGTLSFFRFYGDSNGDGVVDASDYLMFLIAYRSGNASGANSIYDSDGNGMFNSGDLAAFIMRFNKRRLS